MLKSVLVCWLVILPGQAPPGGYVLPPTATASSPRPNPDSKRTPLRKDPSRPAPSQHEFLREHDRNGDGVLARSEVPERLARKFEQADANRDGVLDAREILFDRGRVGQHARRSEALKLDRAGKLVRRGRGADPAPALVLAVEALHRLDTNADGYVDLYELESFFRPPAGLVQPFPGADQPALAPAGNRVAPGDAARTDLQPNYGGLDASSPPRTSKQEKRSSRLAADGYPSVEAILKNLDRDQNGRVDRSEAVDRLADNFDRLDRDRNGGLDAAELDRALRLGRLLGLKPVFDPRTYKKSSPPESAGSPSAPVPLAPNRGRL